MGVGVCVAGLEEAMPAEAAQTRHQTRDASCCRWPLTVLSSMCCYAGVMFATVKQGSLSDKLIKSYEKKTRKALQFNS